MQVGILRRGRYARGKRIGKGPVAEEVCTPAILLSNIFRNCLKADIYNSNKRAEVMVEAAKQGRGARGYMLQGSRVKKGQPLAFIEQLGTYVPVEVCLPFLFKHGRNGGF